MTAKMESGNRNLLYARKTLVLEKVQLLQAYQTLRAGFQRIAVFTLLLLCFAPLKTAKASNGHSTLTSTPSVARCGASATLLPNGEVLVVGGITEHSDFSKEILASAEIFDPVTDTWSNAESLGCPRYHHSAIVLPNGKVLVSGGFTPAGAYCPPEIFDPVSSTWSNPAYTGSIEGSPILLKNGKVLFMNSPTALLYDPLPDTWTPVTMPANMFGGSGTLLLNGKVLLIGGANEDSKLYDPVTNTLSSAARPAMSRIYATTTLLRNGKVLLQGGDNADVHPPTTIYSAELYDPETNTWSSAGENPLSTLSAQAILLANGKVAIMGGWDNTCANSYQPSSKTIMVYDPSSNSWAQDIDMQVDRNQHIATLLPNGKVFVIGRCNCEGGATFSDLGELYH